MFGKFEGILPRFGKSPAARGKRFCQCLAKFRRFCQTLAKPNRAQQIASRPLHFRPNN
jgi:hypothetical protein